MTDDEIFNMITALVQKMDWEVYVSMLNSSKRYEKQIIDHFKQLMKNKLILDTSNANMFSLPQERQLFDGMSFNWEIIL